MTEMLSILFYFAQPNRKQPLQVGEKNSLLWSVRLNWKLGDFLAFDGVAVFRNLCMFFCNCCDSPPLVSCQVLCQDDKWKTLLQTFDPVSNFIVKLCNIYKYITQGLNCLTITNSRFLSRSCWLGLRSRQLSRGHKNRERRLNWSMPARLHLFESNV